MAANQDVDANGKPTATQGDEETPSSKKELKPQPAEEIDYKVKFTESQKEALRLRDEKLKADEQLKQVEDVMTVLSKRPELLAQVQSAYDEEYNPTPKPTTSETGTVANAVAEHKVREVVKPIQDSVDLLQRERNQEVFEAFVEAHPDIAPGTPKADKFVENLQIMSKAGVPIREGMKKAFELTMVDEARRTGRTEAIKAIFEKTQASAGSGSSAAAGRQKEAELTPAEKATADNLGIPYDKYAKQKAQK